ncbi:MAG TPA: C-terminal helicase domain-containing protein, partial [Chlamydiales bacterium]|nr:C-terminal helicase domain-containing protein [Chlamydiales bacterium]
IIHSAKTKHENIDQKLHYVDDLHHKNRLLDHILNDNSVYNAIIFTSTKRHADQLVGELCEKGHKAGALHGDMNQRKRTQTLINLRKGRINLLVATDVAARGIDIDSITHVINFDLPQNPEDYVHRIGRTGRAGANGTALSFASNRDKEMVRRIEKFTEQSFVVHEIEGLAPQKKQKSSRSSKSSKFSRSSRSSRPDFNKRFQRKKKPAFRKK